MLFWAMATINTANAQSQTAVDPYTDGNLSVARCIAKGNFEFGTFLDTVTYNDSFQEGIIEPWNDVLKRNQCHAIDVMGLIKLEDKIRKSIRDAYLTCNTQKLPHLKASYNKTLVEIYYVRHLVEGGIVLALPYDILSTRVGDEAIFTDPNKLYDDMYVKFVNENAFNESDFVNLYLMLEAKYKERKNSYIKCETNSWQEVKQKWDEFKKYFAEGGMTNDLKNAGKTLSSRGSNLVKEIKSIKTVELLNNETSFQDYVKSFAQLNINKFEAEEGGAQISNFFQKSVADSGPAPTQSQILSNVSSVKKTYEINKLQTELSSEFESTYFTASDQSIEVLLNNLDVLIYTLGQSLPIMDQVKEKARTIERRQCVELK